MALNADGTVRAVWTDFGGVLTSSNDETTVAFCQRVGLRPDQWLDAVTKVTRTYGTTDPMEPLDTPMVSELDWARQVEQVLARDHGVEIDLGDPGEYWFTDRPVNTEWLQALRALRAEGVFVGLLSNMVPTWDRHWRRMVPPEGLFEGLVLSYEVGCRKPSKEIFEVAAGVAQVPPEQCLLVDDLARNCAGAEGAGWRAVEFTTAAEAIPQVAALTGIKLGTADVVEEES
ncbi:HAD family hydrolase [Allostreptomyces psammosilenae]|uniref:Putative hydrolase of the HAD superfamily n=1 Tax=Allostreptomyces psammosilenae TaxID=1892865 RepID=A0A852ZUD6_9ACTN|nr:HAD family phosphatase [Allostreptomyces psammosilenae]NYI04900.1 putative hydrolase of the HAD superfamily [Allostreptomyces psammosilenae]